MSHLHSRRSKLFPLFIVLVLIYGAQGLGSRSSNRRRLTISMPDEWENENELSSDDMNFNGGRGSEIGVDSIPVTVTETQTGPLPLVLWHGMGDTAVGVKFALRFLLDAIPGLYIKSLQFGSNPAKDMESGYFMNVNDQVTSACETLKGDIALASGYNAIGLSQGGQFLRAVAQRCSEPPMVNLISLGGQHQGIFGLPKCSAPKQSWCEIVDKLLTHVAYADWVQKFLVQAEYWHDPFKQDDYASNSVFLADINNEKVLNLTYKENLQKLKNFVMVLFQNDSIVQPKETEWFGFFEPGQDKIITPLKDSPIYKEDRLGLKEMDNAGKLHFLSVEGDHLRFSRQWFIDNIVKPFLL